MAGSATDRALSVHRRSIIVDGHCDSPFRMHIRNVHLDEHDTEAQLDLKTMEASGITASFFAAYVPPHYANRGAAKFAQHLIDLIKAEAARRSDKLDFVTDSAGIRATKKAGRMALMIGIEGGHAIEHSLDLLRDFYAQGVRYMTLTHTNTNTWCDSSGDKAVHNGLTDFGRDVVRTMNDLGMIVDISHVSDKAFYDTIETTRVPIIASHSSCRSICRHPRNMTDDMLKTLADNGGVCMINFFSAFLNDKVAEIMFNAGKRKKPSEVQTGPEEMPDDQADWDGFLAWYQELGCPQSSIDDIADHVMHAVKVAGADHVGIGSDFDGVPSLPHDLPDAGKLPLVTERLLSRGLSETDVEKVLGGNFMRVYEAIEAGKRG